jgi:hypothetical protein
MRRKVWRQRVVLGLLLSVALLAGVGCQSAVGAVSNAESESRLPALAVVAPPPGAPAVPLARTNPAGPGGIVVHGHWVFDVLDPDGTAASHHELENALTASGSTEIAQLLTGGETLASSTAGRWLVGIAFDGNAGGGGAASFSETLPVGADRHLTITVPTAGSDANKIVLSGQETNTSFDFHLTKFTTSIQTCVGATCGFKSFSSHDVPAPPDPAAVVVSLNQILQVRVVISFSPAS